MPSRIFGSLSMHSTVVPSSWLRSTLTARCCGWLAGAALESGTSTEKREPRPDAERSVDLVVEHARDALDDRQAEAQAARHLGALVEPLELAEDHALLGLRNAEPGVVDVDAQLAARAPAADQHAALRRVFDGVGDQVLQQPPQQAAVGAHAQRAGHEFQRQALLARQRRELDLELAQQLVDAEA